jgi:hypothetical protein
VRLTPGLSVGLALCRAAVLFLTAILAVGPSRRLLLSAERESFGLFYPFVPGDAAFEF